MLLKKRRLVLLVLSLIATFVTLRLYLAFWPGTNLDIGGYNIHHLFSGLLLVVLGGAPLVLFDGDHAGLDVAAVLFGCGLSMALDEWIYLIVTDGSDTAYLLPVSFWGAVIMIGLTVVYVAILGLVGQRAGAATDGRQR